jgi:hypothetical protein
MEEKSMGYASIDEYIDSLEGDKKGRWPRAT